MPKKSDSDWERRYLRLPACLLRAFTANTSIVGSGEAATGAMLAPELVPIMQIIIS